MVQGGQAILSLITWVFRCRGARWARLILRKQGGIFDWISFPADAFSAQRPCFRATSLLFGRKKNRKSEGRQAIKGDIKGCLVLAGNISLRRGSTQSIPCRHSFSRLPSFKTMNFFKRPLTSMKGSDTKISNDDLVKSQENFLSSLHSLASYECVGGGEILLFARSS